MKGPMIDRPNPIRVLLVEDNPVDVLLVEAQLSQSGTDFCFDHAETLEGALQCLSVRHTDVILLDLTLPDSSELETFAKLHAKCVDIPVVILTGREDVELASKAVREGAQDYLFKGKIDSESLARSIRYAIERNTRQKAEKELGAAGEIHRHLLPKSAPQLPHFDIGGRCEPATFAGGDYFDFFTTHDNRLMVAIADVAGHGMGPALMMAETRIVIRTLAPASTDLGDLLSRANEVLQPDFVDNAFVAAFVASIDPHERQFEYASAGHPAFVLARNNDIKEQLKSSDPPLGIIRHHRFISPPPVRLEVGEALFAFTDGIVESCDRTNEPFGENRLFEELKAAHPQDAKKTIATIFAAVHRFAHQDTQVDDMTAILLRAR